MEREPREDYEYEIYVDDKVVWRGLNTEKVYDEICKKNPGKKISIGWKFKGDVLIA